LWTLFPGCLWTAILLSSASWVARITATGTWLTGGVCLCDTEVWTWFVLARQAHYHSSQGSNLSL
jgi:hypothetical protein